MKAAKCLGRCRAKLSCGHQCTARCHECQANGLHSVCTQRCNRALICGHMYVIFFISYLKWTSNFNQITLWRCEAKCTKVCPPCKKPCGYQCSHQKCSASCGDECFMCMVTSFKVCIVVKFLIVICFNRKPVAGNASTRNAPILVTNFAIGSHVTSLVTKPYLVVINVTASAVKTVHQNVCLVLVKKC